MYFESVLVEESLFGHRVLLKRSKWREGREEADGGKSEGKKRTPDSPTDLT